MRDNSLTNSKVEPEYSSHIVISSAHFRERRARVRERELPPELTILQLFLSRSSPPSPCAVIQILRWSLQAQRRHRFESGCARGGDHGGYKGGKTEKQCRES